MSLLVKELEEKTLLEALSKGDTSAFDSLFRSYYKYLVLIAYKYTKDQDLSKDMVQEVYMDVWKRREVINIDLSIKYFLRRAVINKCLASKRKSDRMTVNTELVNEYKGADNLTSDTILYNDLNKSIYDLVEELPDRCKEVFKLSRFENLSHKEIAEKLSISVKTIENQMTKALKYLRLNLKELGFISFLGFFLSLL